MAVPFVGAAEPAADVLHAALKGRWEGTLNGTFRSQDVSWQLDVDPTGALKGYVGPSLAGMPDLPMQNLVVSGDNVSFSIDAQHVAFEGVIAADGIAGIWQQGESLSLRMKKRNFVFPASASIRAALLGHWELTASATAVHLDFAEVDGMLTGALAVPSLNLSGSPLVDIFMTDEGYTQVATDDGRRFSGRLLNGVLVGDYSAPTVQQSATFSRPDQVGRRFDLDVTDADYEKVAGRWYGQIAGDDSMLEFSRTQDNKVRGQLVSPESRLDVPLLELVVDGENLGFTTFNGRTFTGAMTDEGIVGEFRANARPYRVTFSRTCVERWRLLAGPAVEQCE